MAKKEIIIIRALVSQLKNNNLFSFCHFLKYIKEYDRKTQIECLDFLAKELGVI